MSPQYIFDLLKTINIPVAYDHFVSKEKPPFIVYSCVSGDAFYADNTVYYDNRSYDINLITEIKDIELERRIETLFNDNKITYVKDENFISSEMIYQITYSI